MSQIDQFSFLVVCVPEEAQVGETLYNLNDC